MITVTISNDPTTIGDATPADLVAYGLAVQTAMRADLDMPIQARVDSTHRTLVRGASEAQEARITAWLEAAEQSGRWVVIADQARVTDEAIHALRVQSGSAGDTAQVELCRAALAGDTAAREQCARAINAARAMAD